MKNILKLFVILFVILNTSCDKWLELDPANEITEKDLYSSSYGYRTAINGLYLQMSNKGLYGAELSYRFIDVLSKQYDLKKDNMYHDKYRDLENSKFEIHNVVEFTETIWEKSYNIIANANNIIKNVKDKPASFFAKGEPEKRMIYGEALACRAFLHFDLLRIFAPSLEKNDGKTYIPYVDTYPNIRPVGCNLDKCLEKVIADLVMAKDLTAAYDTTDNGSAALSCGEARFLGKYSNTTLEGSSGTGVNVFFKNRGFRLNYNAITAVLARVYQYAGEHELALKEAEELMNFEHKFKYNEGKNYEFNTYGVQHSTAIVGYDEIIEAWNSKTNLRLLDNLIFACYAPDLHEYKSVYENFYNNTTNGSSSTAPKYFMPKIEAQKIFETSDGVNEKGEDIRYKYMIFHANSGTHAFSGKWYISEIDDYRKNSFNIIPMIRLTEMYYIAAESYARAGNFDKAKELLETVRTERGCTNSLTIGDLEEFKKELIIDARREWISEGQLFYLYKRLNTKVDIADGNEPRELTNEETVMPLPANQSL